MIKTLMITAAFLLTATTMVGAGDIQSWSPKTSAGGAYVPPATLFETAVSVEKGSKGISSRSTAAEQIADTVTLVFDRDGNVIRQTGSTQTIISDR